MYICFLINQESRMQIVETYRGTHRHIHFGRLWRQFMQFDESQYLHEIHRLLQFESYLKYKKKNNVFAARPLKRANWPHCTISMFQLFENIQTWDEQLNDSSCDLLHFFQQQHQSTEIYSSPKLSFDDIVRDLRWNEDTWQISWKFMLLKSWIP